VNHVVFRESRSLLLSNKDSYVRVGAHKKVVSRNRKSPVKNGIISTSPGFLNYLSDFLGAREPIRSATGAHFSNCCSSWGKKEISAPL
jgi:hypothetical protein